MVFSSMTFLFLFLPIVVGIYYLVPGRVAKNFVLLVSSLVFYAWGEPVYIVLILLSTVNDYTFARLVDRSRRNNKEALAKLFFILSLIVNLGLLGFYKYGAFIIENINGLFSANIQFNELPLPIGISFYTFQTMSYSIDVYLGNVKAQKKLLPMATYVALFPQLIAGPIVRYITIENELSGRKESLELVAKGMRRFIIGLSKKVIIANQMGYIADRIFNEYNGDAGTILTWFAVICYSFQIYYDFSGYSDMAIGLGKVFGFNFLENFNYPYISKSITEFWRRWHISLGTWFRDYVYIPLGGNRHHQLRNICIVWLLTGLWHGASWNYILWGGYYGTLLILEKYVFGKYLKKLPSVISHLYTIFFVLIGWTLFRLENMDYLLTAIKTMIIYQPQTLRSLMFTYQDMLYAVPFVLLAFIGSLPIIKNLGQKMQTSSLALIEDGYLIICFVVSITFLLGETFNPFIYFRF